MKKAYQYLLRVKDSLSVGKMLEKFKDAHLVLLSPAFKALESSLNSPGMVSSEELPLAMFLTNFREEASHLLNPEANKLLTDELNNLFKVLCSERQIAWIFDTHIKAIVSQRQPSSAIETLLFATELREAIDLDHFFKFKVEPGKSLRENDVFHMRSKFSEKELLAHLQTAS